MPTCTFFGHRDCPDTVKEALTDAIRSLILEQGVLDFYIGEQGNFDFQVLCVLRELKKSIPSLRYTVALAYYPPQKGLYAAEETLFCDEVACAPRRFAIDRRNRFLLARSDFVVCYVRRSTGGAARFAALAQKQGKKVIYL